MGFLIGTPPPRPLGALVSFPLAWYLALSFPEPVELVEAPAEVVGRWNDLGSVEG